MSGKPEQVLIIEPEYELRFRGPFTGAPIASYISLKNPTNHRVYYKIKTTAPKKYCVRPNSGELPPYGVNEIAVCLQLSDFDPNEKSKHKFMVQTIIAENESDNVPMQDVWTNVTPDKLMDTKLKCVFENPVSSNAVSKGANVLATTAKSDSNSTSEKNKTIAECAKSSPKSSEDFEEKLTKAAQEINQLRVDESKLRQENLQLKEEVLRWRGSATNRDTSLSAVAGMSTQISSPLPMSTTSIMIAIAMVVVGFLMGKLF